ncbi:MAG: ATP-binding protein [Opitutus sp.]
MKSRRAIILVGLVLLVAALIDLATSAMLQLGQSSVGVGNAAWWAVSFLLSGIGLLALVGNSERGRIVTRATAIVLALVATGPSLLLGGIQRDLILPAAFIPAGVALAGLTSATYQRIGATLAAMLSIPVGFVGLAVLVSYITGFDQTVGDPYFALRASTLFPMIGTGLFLMAQVELQRVAASRQTPLLDKNLSAVTGACLGLLTFCALVLLSFGGRNAQDVTRLNDLGDIRAALRAMEVRLYVVENTARESFSSDREFDFVAFSRAFKQTQQALRRIVQLPLSRFERPVIDGLVARGTLELGQLQAAADLRRAGRPGAAEQAFAALKLSLSSTGLGSDITRLDAALQAESLDRAQRPSGRNRKLLAALVPAAAALVVLLGTVHWLIHRDRRERQRAEAALRRHNETLKGFAHTVAHDLRAPLRGIAGYASELDAQAPQLTPRGRHCVAQINVAAQNLERLIGDTLAYAQLDGETVQLSTVVLPTLVATLLQQRAPEIRQHGTQIDTHFGVVTVKSWERGLVQIVGNLLDNAIKYSRHARPPRLRIETAQTHLSWRIVIYDNGVGFDMKYHDRIFGLFQRLVTPDEFEGTGAGLAIVRKITDRLGGTVSAEGRPGGGATFLVELPAEAGSELV